jgi:hypothetical protein
MSYEVTIGTENNISVTLSPSGPQGPAGPVGISWESAWVTSTSYALNNVVNNGGSSYICIFAHTSAESNEPGAGASWETYWEVLAASGSVSSIDIIGGTGVTSSGGPITTSGSITVALDGTTQSSLALADSALQSVVGTTDQIVVTDGDTISLATAVTSSLALADSALQSVTGTTDQIVVTDGDTISLATAVTSSLALADSATQPANIANMVESDPTGITGADAITNIVSLTQAEYGAIGSPDAATLYVVTP